MSSQECPYCHTLPHSGETACKSKEDAEGCVWFNTPTWKPLPAGSLTVDPEIARGFPDGTVDRSTYEDIETALDMVNAPTKSEDSTRWLTLPERIRALAGLVHSR